MLLVEQAPLLDGLALDAFAFRQDGLAATEVDVGRGKVAQAFVVALVIVVGDERFDPGLEIAGHVLVLQQDANLQGLMPALDLALNSRRTGGAAHTAHGVVDQQICQLTCDAAGPVVRQQARPMRTHPASAAVDDQAAAEIGIACGFQFHGRRSSSLEAR